MTPPPNLSQEQKEIMMINTIARAKNWFYKSTGVNKYAGMAWTGGEITPGNTPQECRVKAYTIGTPALGYILADYSTGEILVSCVRFNKITTFRAYYQSL